MVHKNDIARDYEVLVAFDGAQTNMAAYPLAITPVLRTTGKEQWGDTTAGMNILVNMSYNWVTPTYVATFASPQGTYSTGTVGGSLATGYWRIYLVNYKLVVNADCSYTVSWDSCDAYLSINGAGETHPVSFGAYTFTSAAGIYDERFNATILTPTNVVDDALINFVCPSNPPVLCFDHVTVSGGYRYKVAGVWTYDPILADGGDTGATCGCYLGLNSPGGADSYNFSAISEVRYEILDGTQTPFSCPCPFDPGNLTGYSFRKTRELKYYSVGDQYIKDKRVSVVSQEVQTSWTCSVDGVTTTGSSDTTTTPTFTTIGGARTVTHFFDDLFCQHTDPDPCISGDPVGCKPTGVDHRCIYRGNRSILWPTLPPCGSGVSEPYIIQDDMGRLHQCYISAGDVYYRRSNDTRSADAWGGMNVKVTTRGDVFKAHFDYDAIYKRVELYFETTAHAVYYTYSVGDEGKTWHAPVLVASSVYNFYTHTNHFNDDKIRAWFVYDSGTSGSGKAKGQYRRYSDGAWSATFTFSNSATALSIADGGMSNLAPGFTERNEWLFSPIMNGGSTPTTWFSNDECRTWRQL